MFILLLVIFVVDCFPVYSYGEQIENIYVLHDCTLVMFYVVVRIIVIIFLKKNTLKTACISFKTELKISLNINKYLL